MRSLPARFSDTRYLPGEGQVAEANTTKLKLPIISTRAPATLAAVVGTHTKFRLLPGLCNHAGLCHMNSFDSGFPISDCGLGFNPQSAIRNRQFIVGLS